MAERWQPRPDPAIHDPGRPGLRPHRHAPNQLHAWVFLQDGVWVDYWGNEHEIEYMPRDYVANVIGFCVRRSIRIRLLVALATIGCAAVPDHARESESFEQILDATLETLEESETWVQGTPLLQALRRRLRSATDSSAKTDQDSIDGESA